MRSFIALVAAAGMLFSAVATDISTAAAFVAAMANDPAGDYTLTDDIDLTGAGYTTIDMFTGSLDGGGHTLKGLGSQTLFNTFAGSVKSLTIDGTVSGNVTTRTASNVGIFCNNSYAGKFTDVVIKNFCLKMGANGLCGGLFTANACDGTSFVRCQTDSSCSVLQNSKANNNIGGFVGKCMAKLMPFADIVFEDCTNNAPVTATGNYNDAFGAGGFVGFATMSSAAPVPRVVFRGCVNNASITGTGDKGKLGGLVGYIQGSSVKEKSNRFYFLNCVNNGTISTTKTEFKLGGLLGSANGGASSAIFDGCINKADISGPASGTAGGLCGFFGQYMSNVSGVDDVTFRNCANIGSVTGKNYAGGIMGAFDTNTGWATGVPLFMNSANYGTLTVSSETGSAGELVAYLTYSTASPLGIIDNCWGKTTNLYITASYKAPTVSNCKSEDDATATDDLNAIAVDSTNYLPWVTGSDGYPHLEPFADVVPAYVTVAFRDWNGDILKKESVASGGTATPPENPSRDGYVFSQWDGSYSGVTRYTDVWAAYNPETIAVTFDADGGIGGKVLQVYAGTYVTPPEVSLSGHSFVGWAYDGVIKDFFVCVDDSKFTAVWKKNKEPYSKKVNFLTWHLKSCDKTNCAARGDALKAIFDEYDVDIAAIMGLSGTASLLDTIIGKLPGYAYADSWANGSADGTRRVIFWKSSSFDKFGSATYKQPSSNSTIGYVPLKMKNKQLIFLPMSAYFSTANNSKTIKDYMTGFASARTALENSYPTAVHLLGTDYAIAAGTQALIDNYTDWAGLRDVFVNTHGYTSLESSDDFQWAFIKSPWSPSTLNVVSSTKVEDADNQDQPGYVTTFTIGVPNGLQLIVR